MMKNNLHSCQAKSVLIFTFQLQVKAKSAYVWDMLASAKSCRTDAC